MTQGILFVGIRIKPYKEEPPKKDIKTKEAIDSAESELTNLSLNDKNVDKNKIAPGLNLDRMPPLFFSGGDTNPSSKVSLHTNSSTAQSMKDLKPNQMTAY